MNTANERRAAPRLLVAAVIAVIAGLAGMSGGGVRAWTTPVHTELHSVSMLTGAELDIGRSIAVAGDGTVLVTGQFRSATLSAGVSIVSATGGDDVFVAKFDAQGEPVWLRSVGGTGTDRSLSVASDGEGGAYVAGRFQSTATFGAYSLTSLGGTEGFIARLDAQGVVLWVQPVGGTGDDEAADLVVGADGDVIVSATVVGTVSVGALTSPATLGDTANGDVIIARFDPSGVARWSVRLGGAGADDVERVALDPAGSILVTGTVAGAATISAVDVNATFPSEVGGEDAFVARVDGDGRFATGWVQRIGSSGTVTGTAIVVDSQRRVTAVSNATGAVTVGASVLPGSASPTRMVLTQFDGEGNLRWVREFDGDGQGAQVRHAALAPDDRVVAVGFVGASSSNATFSALAYDSGGTLTWGPRSLGAAGNQIAQGVSVDAAGNVVLTGRFAGGRIDADDPASNLTVWGDSDVPVIMLRRVLPPAPAVAVVPPGLAPLVTAPVVPTTVPTTATTPVTPSPSVATPAPVTTTAPPHVVEPEIGADGRVVGILPGGAALRIDGLGVAPSGGLVTRAGDILSLTLDGLTAGGDLRVEMFSTPRLLWSGVADSEGSLTASFSIPDDQGRGLHTLRISGTSLSGPFVLEAAVTVADLEQRLPATGVDVPLMLALAMIGAGLVVVARGRRVARW